jgi:cell division transport system permease protein
MSVASILILASCLVVLGGFGLIVYNLNINLDNLVELNEIVVFLEYDADEEEIASVKASIEALDNVAAVRYVSKAEGLEAMKNQAGGSSVYDDIPAEDNPLADCFYVSYEDNAKVSTLDYNLRQLEGVRKVNNRLDTAVMIENTKNVISIVFSWFLLILIIVSVFIIVNTIKLAVFARREEIFIMRYVGAGRWFITLPFIIEGFIFGLISSVCAYFVEIYAYSYIFATVQSDVQFLKLCETALVAPYLLVTFLAVGVVTGIVGSSISLGKYLNA